MQSPRDTGAGTCSSVGKDKKEMICILGEIIRGECRRIWDIAIIWNVMFQSSQPNFVCLYNTKIYRRNLLSLDVSYINFLLMKGFK